MHIKQLTSKWILLLVLLWAGKAVWGQELDVPLVDLIAKMADYNPKITHLDTLDQLLTLTHQKAIDPKRIIRIEQLLPILARHQFALNLTVRELVANAIDAYYYAPDIENQDKVVDIVTTESEGHMSTLTVADHGIGMGLHEVVYYLLTPQRSSSPAVLNPSQAREGVTGKFGQGFFSAFAFLKEPTDSITVKTQKDKENPLEITLTLQDKKIIVHLRQIKESSQGTQIQIHTHAPIADMAKTIVPDYFEDNDRALILLNGVRINGTDELETRKFLIEVDDKEVSIPLKQTTKKVADGEGKVRILVNGIKVKDFIFQGRHIFSKIAVEFPPTALYSADRNTFDYTDAYLQSLLVSLTKKILENQDYALFNSLYPLLELFHSTEDLKGIPLPNHVVPAVPELDNLMAVEGQPVERVHLAFFEIAKLAYWDPNLDTKNIFIRSTFVSEEERVQSIHTRGKNLIFLRQDLDSENYATQIWIHLFQKIEEAKKGSPFSFIDFTQILTDNLEAESLPLDKQERVHELPEEIKNSIVEKVYSIFEDPGHRLHMHFYRLLEEAANASYISPSSYPFFIHFACLFAFFIPISGEFDIEYLKVLYENKNKNAHFLENLKKLATLFFKLGHEGGTSLISSVILKTHVSIRNLETDAFTEQMKTYFQFLLTSGANHEDWNEETYEGPFMQDVDAFQPTLALIQLCTQLQILDCTKMILQKYSFFSSAINNRADISHRNNALLQQIKFVSMMKKKKIELQNSLGWEKFATKYLLHRDDIANIIIPIQILNQFQTLIFEKLQQILLDDMPPIPCEEILYSLLQQFEQKQIAQSTQEDLSFFLRWIKENEPFSAEKLQSTFGKTRPSLSSLFSYLVAHMPASITAYILPVFSEKEVFPHENGTPFARGFSPPLLPIEKFPVVQDILGADPELIHSIYQVAKAQNSLPFVWMRELLKNAHEADSLDFNVTVNTDDQNRLVVEVQDHGNGVSIEQMYNFYIPGLTSKVREGEDINFGWGFFTIFREFDEVVVISSQDARNENRLYLRKTPENYFEIAVDSQLAAKQGAQKGTTIYLRKSRPFQRQDPMQIKAHLLSNMVAFPLLKVSFNGEFLKNLNIGDLTGEPVLIVDVPKSEIITHSSGGIFYKKMPYISSVQQYVETLSPALQELYKLLPYRFAINIEEIVSQDGGRAGFLEEEKWKDIFSKAIKKALLEGIALENTKNPTKFAHILPYDFYYEFARNLFATDPVTLDHVQDLKGAARYLVELPIYRDSHLSLLALKEEIKTILLHHHILDAEGNYQHGSWISPSLLKHELPDPRLASLLDWFERKIENHLLLVNSTQNDTSHADFSDDFDLAHVPDSFALQKPNLIRFGNFFAKQSLSFLHESIEISFYDKMDATDAHAQQGQTTLPRKISFNLRLSTLREFEKMHVEKKCHFLLLFRVFFVLTHEITHTYESTNETTHDAAFYTKQQKFIQRLFSIGDAELEGLKHELMSIP